MKRCFNYTGRLKITLDKVQIKLVKYSGIVKSFTATIDLKNLNLPNEAKVTMEAYYRYELIRFDFGTVEQIRHPEHIDLSSLSEIDRIKFRLLITEGKTGKILASADKIKSEEQENSPGDSNKSLLPVQFKDLGRLVWQISFDGEQPVLMINSNIPGIKETSKLNSRFFFFVYPQVMREILNHIFLIDMPDSFDDPDTEWQRDWLLFAKQVIPFTDMPTQDTDVSDKIRWINNVIEEFCTSRTKEWSKFIDLEKG